VKQYRETTAAMVDFALFSPTEDGGQAKDLPRIEDDGRRSPFSLNMGQFLSKITDIRPQVSVEVERIGFIDLGLFQVVKVPFAGQFYPFAGNFLTRNYSFGVVCCYANEILLVFEVFGDLGLMSGHYSPVAAIHHERVAVNRINNYA
jgi:hypothetical protein